MELLHQSGSSTDPMCIENNSMSKEEGHAGLCRVLPRSLSLYIYMYPPQHMYVYTYMHIYVIYIYIYIYCLARYLFMNGDVR